MLGPRAARASTSAPADPSRVLALGGPSSASRACAAAAGRPRADGGRPGGDAAAGPGAAPLSPRRRPAAGRRGRRGPAAGPPRRPGQAPDGGWAVETHGLTKRFGSNVAVDDVELLVPRGCAFGYLGPNGAGKTTLIRTLLGLTRADGGTMSLLGIPVPAERSRALARVGAIVDEPRFHAHLTGRENLRLLAAARGGEAAADRSIAEPGSASPAAPTTRSPPTRWACASASA